MPDVPARLAGMVAEAKGIALYLLKGVGIEDNFLVRVKPASSARRLRGGGAWLALYRARTQFTGWCRPIFWISADIEKTVTECHREECIWCQEGAARCAHLEQDLSNTIVDSLLHEYGHVIWEFAELRHPDLWALIGRYIVEGGEETFAEDFMKFCRGDETFMDGDADLMRQIIQLHMQRLRETSE